MSGLSKSITAFLESSEPGIQETMKTSLDRLKAIPSLPPEIKQTITDATSKADWEKTLSGFIWYHLGILPAILSSGTAFANLVNYDVERQRRTYRLDAMSIITAWRRDPEKHDKYFDDLKEQGWSDDRIEALKFFTLYYPTPQELIHWQAREVFEPEMRAKYGLDAEKGALKRDAFYKAGMDDTQIDNHWAAHWEHPEYRMIVEMLRRGLITEEDMSDWFRLVEIPPYWRDKLIETSWEIPTRVDVRRWWDMRVIDESELRRIYRAQGYHGDDLENYVKWTKVYTDFPVMMARFTKGWITEAEVKSWLIAQGIPEERAQLFIEEKVKPEEPARLVNERDLTKAEIVKGVKKQVITYEEGIDLLIDMGYGREEADYILAINIEALSGSPETLPEFKSLTMKYRRATGREVVPVPEQLKQAAQEIIRLTADVANLDKLIKEEARGLTENEILPATADSRLKELQVKRNRALSSLAAAKSAYDTQLAEWRHSGNE